MRDSQRSRLYKAERTVAACRARPFGSTVETWAYLERVERDGWFKRHYGIKHFRLATDDRGRVGRATQGGTWMRLPPWTRYPLYILHEVAHTVTRPGLPAHGHEYAATFLRLVRHFLGAEAHAELRAAFKVHKVRYTPPRQISPEQRVAMVARLAAARSRPSVVRDADGDADHERHDAHDRAAGLGYHPE